MIPHTPQAIGFITQRLMTHVLPDVGTNYGVADLALIGTLLNMIGQDFERSAQARLEDIHEMRALFVDAASLIGDAELTASLHNAQARTLEDLRISALDDVHALHSRLLIDVHARVEQLEGADARALDTRIWEHLARHAERHRYDVAM